MSRPKPIQVLHDFDNPYMSGRYALRRGIKLIIYAISKRIPFLRKIVKEIYDETCDNCVIIAHLDRLSGIQSRFGLKDETARAFPLLADELRNMGFEVHRHMHDSKTNVSWDPPLDVPFKSWFFDQQFASTGQIPDDLVWAVFHADYPHLLPSYIRFLDKAKSMGRLG